MADELDRFSLILGPGEKIEEPEPPPKPKKTKPRTTNDNPTDWSTVLKKLRPGGKSSRGKKRYRIRNRAASDVLIRMRSNGNSRDVLIKKGETLYANVRSEDLGTDAIRQMVGRGYITVEEVAKEGSVVYLQPDGSCSTTPPKSGETAVVMGYLAPVDSMMSDGYVTLDTNVDGFDTSVLIEGTASDQKSVVKVGGGEVVVFDASNGEILDPYGNVGSTPYGAPKEKTVEEEFAEALGLDEY